MKIKLVVMAALLLFSAVSVQASTPDILSSVSPGSVQLLTKAESAEARGEYWVTYHYSNGTNSSGFQFSTSRLPSFQVIGTTWITRSYWTRTGNFYVSR